MVRALIFDFDGVIADSEVLANQVLADVVTELGVPTSLADAYRGFMGRRFDDVIAAVEAAVGRPLPEDFPTDYQRRTLDCFRRELRAIDGARACIEAFPELRRCIASSSSPDRLALCLEVLGFDDLFGDAVFSASSVPRGKPHPDVFLYAARRLEVAPLDCLVIEDSAEGVRAGKAAGSTVIGFLAGKHVQTGHDSALTAAGADYLAASFPEVEVIVRSMLGEARPQR